MAKLEGNPDRWAQKQAPFVCCRQHENLRIVEQNEEGSSVVYRCEGCGRRHYRVFAKPIDLQGGVSLVSEAGFAPGVFKVG